MHKPALFVLSFLLGATLYGCTATGSGAAGSSDESSADAVAAGGALLDGGRWTHYGGGVHEGEVIAAADVLARPAEFTGKPMRVEGPIIAVCQQKGCWARIGTEQDNMMVRFKDYAFFLPTDAQGTLVMEGVVSVDEVSVEQRKHYLEDEGKSEEAAKITEPATEVRFMASGVAIARQ